MLVCSGTPSLNSSFCTLGFQTGVSPEDWYNKSSRDLAAKKKKKTKKSSQGKPLKYKSKLSSLILVQ